MHPHMREAHMNTSVEGTWVEHTKSEKEIKTKNIKLKFRFLSNLLQLVLVIRSFGLEKVLRMKISVYMFLFTCSQPAFIGGLTSSP